MECNQSNRSPKRIDKVRDKLLAIESLAYKARHLTQDKESELRVLISKITKDHEELLLFVNTSEEAGKKKGWWK